MMDILNPVVHAFTSTNINRRTVENIRMAGLEIVSEINMGGSKIMKMIKAVRVSIDENIIRHMGDNKGSYIC